MITNEDGTRQEVLKRLAAIENGIYEVRKPFLKWFTVNNGWICVSRDKQGLTSLMWTSHEDHHVIRLGAPSRIVDITPDGRLRGFYETALSLWLKWGYGQGTKKDYENGIKFCMRLNKYLK